MERVLVISAHPDDEVLGMGGTIAKYASNGSEITLLIVTDGSTSQYRNDPNLEMIIQEKKEETRKSADILGIKEVVYGNLPDMKLDSVSHIEINNVIEQVIEKVHPSIVYTHFYGDINKDHRMVYESTLVACRPTSRQCVKKVFLYSVPSSTEWNVQINSAVFLPNWYEDISGTYAEKKYLALECYSKELRDYPHPRSIQYVKNADIVEGNRVGLQSSESFMLVRSVNA